METRQVENKGSQTLPGQRCSSANATRRGLRTVSAYICSRTLSGQRYCNGCSTIASEMSRQVIGFTCCGIVDTFSLSRVAGFARHCKHFASLKFSAHNGCPRWRPKRLIATPSKSSKRDSSTSGVLSKFLLLCDMGSHAE